MTRGDYTYSFGNDKVTGSAISNLVNTSIGWEKKKTLDFGFDLGMFNNQLEFTFDWYKSISEAVLYEVPVPTQVGVTNSGVRMNASTMVNSGLEFLLAYHNHHHAVKFDVSTNLSTLSNEVTKLDLLNKPLTVGYCRTEVGREVGEFYGYVSEGIFQSQSEIDNRVNSKGEHVNQPGAKPGDVIYANLDDNTEVNNLDQQYLGSGIAKIHYGLDARAEWKGFDLSIATYGAANFNAVDFVDVTLHSSYGPLNKSVDQLNAWTPGEHEHRCAPRIIQTGRCHYQRYVQPAIHPKCILF